MYFLIILMGIATAKGFSINKPEDDNGGGMIMDIWAKSAYQWIMEQNCNDINNMINETCYLMKKVSKSHYRIYGTEPSKGVKYGVLFPDGEFKNIHHDGVIVLDPFPTARFGHQILVFLVDIENRETCEPNGIFVGDQYCLKPWNKYYCGRNKYSYHLRLFKPYLLNCGEVVFLPLVYSLEEPSIQTNNRLRCFSNIQGFNPICPSLRPKARSTSVSCHPYLNNLDCGFYESTMGGRCSNSKTCDHAVLLSGGWNRQLSDTESLNNILKIRKMLISQGFLEDNIAMFYANGNKKPPKRWRQDDSIFDDDDYEDEVIYYSSALKTTMRNHIRTLCASEFCSDTLFIYMNSPTKPDGTSLLWDLIDNGVYNENELYPPKEFLRDISTCNAKRVVVIADQSYGSALTRAAEARFMHLKNVMIFTSTDDFNDRGPRDRLTWFLLKQAMDKNFCLNDFKNEIVSSFDTKLFIGVQPDILNSTLIGGPCTKPLPSLSDPENLKYMGCSLAPVV